MIGGRARELDFDGSEGNFGDFKRKSKKKKADKFDIYLLHSSFGR